MTSTPLESFVARAAALTCDRPDPADCVLALAPLMLELVERMPSLYKVSPLGERKWLYRQAAARHLPPELARRLCPPRKRFERKRGFSQPLSKWFDTERGLLAKHELWARPLIELFELPAQGIEAVLGEAGAPGMVRRRSVLYALAQWLATNPPPAQAAA